MRAGHRGAEGWRVARKRSSICASWRCGTPPWSRRARHGRFPCCRCAREGRRGRARCRGRVCRAGDGERVVATALLDARSLFGPAVYERVFSRSRSATRRRSYRMCSPTRCAASCGEHTTSPERLRFRRRSEPRERQRPRQLVQAHEHSQHPRRRHTRRRLRRLQGVGMRTWIVAPTRAVPAFGAFGQAQVPLIAEGGASRFDSRLATCSSNTAAHMRGRPARPHHAVACRR
jgi:hypothetical protein